MLLITAGFHVPVIPFVEVVGKTGAVLPEHKVKTVPKSNVGVTTWFTVTINVAGARHSPGTGVGVNV